ncbi:MAG: sensor histidine kinase [Ferruginibacter sp.]
MKKSFIILLHVGYWLLYLLLILLFILFIKLGSGKSFSQDHQMIISLLKIMGTFTIIPGLIGFYTFYGVLFNRYLSKKKIGALCAVGLGTVLLSGIISLAGVNLATNGMIFKYNGIKEMSFIVIFMSLLTLVHGIIALVMKGFITWYGDIKVKAALKQKNFETELALIKSQLNPHFLFNTINNIDVLIEKDPAKASAYLNKLSDIMRFMLYETKTENIPLEKELNYINKYIELQKIRSANDHFVRYNTSGDAREWIIAPMLFIPFIENAFKHSVNKRSGNGIIVRIGITGDSLDFYCENNFGENPLIDHEAGGLGNDLIKKRLNLLYPSRYELKIEQGNNIYKVHLVIYRGNKQPVIKT